MRTGRQENERQNNIMTTSTEALEQKTEVLDKQDTGDFLFSFKLKRGERECPNDYSFFKA